MTLLHLFHLDYLTYKTNKLGVYAILSARLLDSRELRVACINHNLNSIYIT